MSKRAQPDPTAPSKKRTTHYTGAPTTPDPGHPALLLTFPRAHRKQAERECISRVQQIMKQQRQDNTNTTTHLTENETSHHKKQVETPKKEEKLSVEEELQEMKEEADWEARSVAHIDCMSVITMKKGISASVKEMAKEICNEAKDAKMKYICRIVPMQRIEVANAKGLETLVKEVALPYFAGENKTYAIIFKQRANSTLDRVEAIKSIADMLDKRHRVDLTYPDLHIIVEVFQNRVGMTVLDDFLKYRRYNVEEIFVQGTMTEEEIDTLIVKRKSSEATSKESQEAKADQKPIVRTVEFADKPKSPAKLHSDSRKVMNSLASPPK